MPLSRRRRAALVAAFLLVALAAGALLGARAALTIDLPEPTGEHPVGRVERVHEDESREENLTAAPGDARRVSVTFYYPATPDARAWDASPYVEGETAEALARQLGPLRIVPDVWGGIHTRVHDGAPVAPGSFPVLLFSPGIDVQPLHYSTLLAEMASHGYVVAALAHPYSSPAVALPDGLALATPEGQNEADGGLEAHLALRAKLAAIWTNDVLFVARGLEHVNASDPLLAGALDVARLGAFGHSFGGAVALDALARDARILAAADLDGTPFPWTANATLGRPALLLEDPPASLEELARMGIPPERAATLPDTLARAAVVTNATPGYRVTIEGFSHSAFATDLVIFGDRMPWFIEDVGTLGGPRTLALLSTYLLDLFDAHLKGHAVVALTPAAAPAGVTVHVEP